MTHDHQEYSLLQRTDAVNSNGDSNPMGRGRQALTHPPTSFDALVTQADRQCQNS